MTSPQLSYTDETGERLYRNPITGRDNYWSITRIIGSTIPNGLHKVPPNILENASARGSYIHQRLEDQNIQDTTIIPPLSINGLGEFMASARRYDAEWKPEIMHTELTVFHDQLGYAGTGDAIAYLPTPNGRRLCWVDYKCSRKLSNYHVLQLAALRYAEYGMLHTPVSGNNDHKQIPLPEVDGCAFVHIVPEGYRVVPVEIGEREFEMFAKCCEVARFPEQLGDQFRPALPTPTLPAHVERQQRYIELARSLDAPAQTELKQNMTDEGLSLSGDAPTHKQLDRIRLLISRADAAHGIPVEYDAEALKARIDSLPMDLRSDLVQTAKDHGWRVGVVRQHSLDRVMSLLAEAENRQCERSMATVSEILGSVGDHEWAIPVVVDMATNGRTDEPDTVTALEAERITAICEALDAGALTVIDGGIASAEHAEQILLDRAESKSNVVKLGKHLAESWQRPKPTSAKSVTNDALLVAGVLAAAA